jgi:hypothetical protein
LQTPIAVSTSNDPDEENSASTVTSASAKYNIRRLRLRDANGEPRASRSALVIALDGYRCRAAKYTMDDTDHRAHRTPTFKSNALRGSHHEITGNHRSSAYAVHP